MTALVIVLIIVMVAYVVYFFHSSWRLYTRFYLDWDTRASLYEESFGRLSQVKRNFPEGEVPAALELMLRHDLANQRRCYAYADQWRDRIPRRLRAYYLRAYR